jgi:CSLREA domain-containing protein
LTCNTKALAAMAAAIGSLAFASSATANTIQVTTAVDEAFQNPGLGCSLREAIAVADNDVTNPTNGCTGGSGTDTITFNPSVSTINLTPDLAHGGDNNHGELIIFSTLNITGPGMNNLTINAPTGGRIFRITSGAAQVNISGLTVQNGSPSEDDESLGGGIRSDAPLALTDVKVADNTATATTDVNADTFAFGGGVYAGDNFTLTDSVVSGNTADAENPAVADGQAVSSGGGVLSGGITQIINSTIDGNTASATDEHDGDSGSGTDNAARTFAGGLATGPLSVTITGSTISNNTSAPTSLEGAAFAWGGGIKLSGGATTIERSTIALNRTDPVGDTFAGGEGGGIIGFGGTLSLQSSTVAINGANSGSSDSANLAVDFGSLVTTAKNTIVGYPLGLGSTNCDAALISAGFNIDSGTSCGLDPGTTTTDQENVTPSLGSLQDNGGPTETMLPQVGSPAIDKGSSVGQTAATDQRGLARPVDAPTGNAGDGSDVGAVEVQAPAAPNLAGTIPEASSTTNSTPLVLGTTDEGSDEGTDGATDSVTIYSDGSCTTNLASDDPATFEFPGIMVTVPENATTTLSVSTVNQYGISSPCSSPALTYTHDSLGPVMTIDSGPSVSTDHTPTFVFHGTDLSPPLSYMCSIDKGTASYTECTSPRTTSSLPDGSYTFRVKGTDSLFQEGSPVTRAFTIKTPAPPVTTPTTPTPTPTTPAPAPKKKKCKKAKKGSASAAKKCKKHKK